MSSRHLFCPVQVTNSEKSLAPAILQIEAFPPGCHRDNCAPLVRPGNLAYVRLCAADVDVTVDTVTGCRKLADMSAPLCRQFLPCPGGPSFFFEIKPD